MNDFGMRDGCSKVVFGRSKPFVFARNDVMTKCFHHKTNAANTFFIKNEGRGAMTSNLFHQKMKGSCRANFHSKMKASAADHL